MNRFRVWGLSAALAAGGGAASAAPPAQPVQPTTLMHKLFGPKPPKPVGPAVPSSPQRPLTITVPLPQEVVVDALRAEQEAYLRRVSVCTELRRVALEKGDDALAKQADELERQSAALYNARVTGLGVSRVKAPLPETPALASAEPILTPEQKAARLVAPAAPVPGSTAEVREVKP